MCCGRIFVRESRKSEKLCEKIFFFWCFRLSLHPQNENGTLTEWLGSGLQNRVQQFESARYLTNKSSSPHLESCSFSLQYAMAWITCAALLITKHKGQFMCAMYYDYVRGGLDYVA